MGKGILKRKRQRKAQAEAKLQGALCFFKDCKQKAVSVHECTTCEKLGKPVYKVATCLLHRENGLQKVRRHAVTKHPANMLRVIGAGLKGEEI